MLRQVLSVASAVLLSITASACTAEAPPIDPPEPRATAVPGAESGNSRPLVSFDGPMVRRRVVLALVSSGADVAAVRAALEPVAARLGMDLTDLPGTVLDPEDLEESFPELTLALPEGRRTVDARALIEASPGAAIPAESIRLATVLVHDLAFTVPAADPGGAGRSIDAEGILSDVLGHYDLAREGSALSVGYTGPLLSDESIGAVRVGMARAADTDPSAVGVFPRTPTGGGVRLPETASAAASATGSTTASVGAAPTGAVQLPVEHGRHGASAAAQGGVSGTTERASALVAPFLVVVSGLAAAWIASLIVIARRRSRRLWEVRHPDG
jgi:hypothetical protein